MKTGDENTSPKIQGEVKLVEPALKTSRLSNNFKLKLEEIVGTKYLICDQNELSNIAKNTLAVTRIIEIAVYPQNIEQLQKIVSLAALHKVGLYPISLGKNVGYGDMAPNQDQQILVHLKHLNKIRSYNEVDGEIVIEPGVSQQQLADFLIEKKSKFFADMTGASPNASIIGNALEAGFGHSPLGDHRKNILQVEAVLADGRLFQTAEMPSIGPDLSGLFIQSNFGIVTAMKIPLMLIPEQIVTFTLNYATEENFLQGLSILTQLRLDGTITSLVHTGNAIRTLMTTSRFPNHLNKEDVITESQGQTMLNERSLIKIGAWTAVGGLYGYKSEVKLKMQRIKKAFAKTAGVSFYSDSKIKWIDRLLGSSLALMNSRLDFTRKSFHSLKALHEILKGCPSQAPSDNIFWKVSDPKNLGLIWFAPVIPAQEGSVKLVLEIARSVFAIYRFDMPVTLTLVNNKSMIAVFNINFDKSNPAEVQRAHNAYKKLSEITMRVGFKPYRIGTLTDAAKNQSEDQRLFLSKMKNVLDPNSIISPGRYGLS